VLDTVTGSLVHAHHNSHWRWCAAPLPPCPVALLAHVGAVQGLLLDLEAATLTVWVNGERKGVMVRPGMTNWRGEPVGRLEGPLGD